MISTKEAELEIATNETGGAVVTVIKGEALVSNDCGSLTVTEGKQAEALKNTSPYELKKISSEEMLKRLDWTDFGNPRIMVMIKEVHPGEETFLSIMESSINKSLNEAYYHLIDSSQIELLRKSDEAKNAMEGDLASAAALGMRLESDIVITGKVETEYVGEIKTGENTIVTCQARCEIRVIIADTAQIILSEKLTEKAASLSIEEAGKKAIEKIAKKISEGLVWSIPLNYAIAGEGNRAIQIIFTDCNFSERNKIIEFLKSTGEIEKVYPRSFENSIAIIDVEYVKSTEDLAEILLNIEDPIIEITGITMNKIEAKISK